MAKVICICGKICSGKSTYAEEIKKRVNAVVLSVDEITLAFFGQQCGDMHDVYTQRAKKYLLKKASELIASGVNVILDWGFWKKAERESVKKFFAESATECEMHYISVDDDIWKERIKKRNRTVTEEKTEAYYIDGNLLAKFESMFEAPTDGEIDIKV